MTSHIDHITHHQHMEHDTVHSSSPIKERQIELSRSRRLGMGPGGRGKVHGIPFIPSSGIGKMPNNKPPSQQRGPSNAWSHPQYQSQAGPSRQRSQGSSRYDQQDDLPDLAAPNYRLTRASSGASSSSSAGVGYAGERRGKKDKAAPVRDDLEGPLGNRKGKAFRDFHANLDADNASSGEASRRRAIRAELYPDYGSMPRAQDRAKNEAHNVDSPDPIDSLCSDTPPAGAGHILNPPRQNSVYDDATPTKDPPVKRPMKNMMATFIKKKPDDVTPLAQKVSKSKHAEWYNKRSASPEPQTSKPKARKSSNKESIPSKKSKSSKSSGSKWVITCSSPEPEPPSSSSAEPDGIGFFRGLEQEEEKEKERQQEEERRLLEEEERQQEEERQRLLEEALNPQADVTLTKTSRQLKREEAELFKGVRRVEQQGSHTIGADDFFKHAPKQAEAARRRRSLEARSRALTESGQFAPKVRELGEDERYCARFKDHSNLCPHCSEALPKAPSADLIALQKRFAGVRNLSFRQTITLCTMHRAETSIIPLGLREGYPSEINFDELDQRLEHGWIATRLKRVAGKPHLSKFYRRAVREVRSMGLSAWKDVGHQANESVQAFAQPGYYGDLGREIMIRHFQNLLLWGHLKLDDATHPLPETDFIVTVLVPEAGVLLTMEDAGWDTPIAKGEEWEDARAAAMDTCKRSGPYGYWRFRSDGDAGRRVLERFERASTATKRRLDAARDALYDNIARKVAAERAAMRPEADVILVASSDTEVPDASDWSGDEVWNDEAVAAVTEAAERRARRMIMEAEVIDVDADDTPKASKVARSSGSPVVARRFPLHVKREQADSPEPKKPTPTDINPDFKPEANDINPDVKPDVKSMNRRLPDTKPHQSRHGQNGRKRRQHSSSADYDAGWDDQISSHAVCKLDDVVRQRSWADV